MKLRGVAKLNAAKTHCKRRHPFNEENTRYFSQNGKKKGGRACRVCARMHERKRREKHKDEINRQRRQRRRLRRRGVR